MLTYIKDKISKTDSPTHYNDDISVNYQRTPKKSEAELT